MEKFVKQLVRDAGSILRDKFGKVGVLRTKSHVLDVVTIADELADKLITDRIKKKFPSHAIVSEESGLYNQNSKKWIIDPLDGTSNFSLGIPLFVTQLAYVENDQVKIAAIYDPIHNNLFYAEKGKGAYLNNKRIKISSKTIFENSSGCVDLGLNSATIKIYDKIQKNIHHKHFWVRNLGAAGIHAGAVANGNLDWAILMGCYVWDYAPMALLVEEAGGMVRTAEGKKWTLTDKDIIAGNPVLVKKLIQILK